MAAGIGAGLALCGTARAASPLDGVYKGASQLSGSYTPQCLPGRLLRIRVEDGHFGWGIGDDRISIAIAGDGSFSGRSGRRGLQGRAEGGQLTAQLYAVGCTYTWALTR